MKNKVGAKISQMSKKKKIISIIAIIVVIFIVVKLVPKNNTTVDDTSLYSYATADRMDITESLTGSGTLQPADQYTVATLIAGDIVSDSFEKGDIVKKDQVLYQMDSSDAQSTIEEAELSATSVQRNYNKALKSLDDLNVKTKVTGTVMSIDVKKGDTVSAGQKVATIRDDSEMTIKLSFPADEAASFHVGQAAVVTLYGSFETINGTVSEISGASYAVDGNMIVRDVKITVKNPGAITESQIATAEVGSSGSTSSGKFEFKENREVLAEVGGDVVSIPVKEGQRVSAGTTLVVLQSDDLTDNVQSAADSVRSSQKAIEKQYNNLKDYSIKSPIDGTVITKDYKAGDTIESGTKLCIIYDLSYLKITMNVDELDIGKVSVGQSVKIKADALPDQEFTGKITSVNLAGTTNNNVTTYPVEVQIDDFGDLLPGMNVSTEIIANEVHNVIGVPVSAVSRGNQVLVYTGNKSDDPSVPEGYEYTTVEIGVSNTDYIEIKSGLNEGDQIAYIMQSNYDDSMNYGDGVYYDSVG